MQGEAETWQLWLVDFGTGLQAWSACGPPLKYEMLDRLHVGSILEGIR